MATTTTTTTKTNEWRPEKPVSYAPLFKFPPKVIELFQWFFGYPGYLWPWNVVFLTVCLVSMELTNPTFDSVLASGVSLQWIGKLYLRNLFLQWLFAGGWHLYLYTTRSRGLQRKYNKRWGGDKWQKRFLFRNQTYDNIFWSCVSGVTIQTAYEALYLWYIADSSPATYYESFWAHPVYSVAWLLLVPIWREFHFYWVHRLTHVKFLYDNVHYLHHLNKNPGPWSGLSMHPVEHLLYFSVVLIHFVVPSHPLHFFFNSQHTALTPAGGHSGFDGVMHSGSYFHYLHHHYFECNYGEATIPLDKWFGTFRDGKSVGLNLKATGGA